MKGFILLTILGAPEGHDLWFVAVAHIAGVRNDERNSCLVSIAGGGLNRVKEPFQTVIDKIREATR